MKKLFVLLLIFLIAGCSGDDNAINTDDDSGDDGDVMIVCGSATSIEINAINSNSAEIVWTSDQNQISVVLEYGLSGFTLGTGTEVALTGNNYTLGNLESNTTYDFYLKTVCVDDLESPYSIVQTFTTLCESQEFTGDITLNTQAELNEFGSNCYTKVNGSLTIGGPNSNITDLSALINLEEIEDNLFILETQVVSLAGLNNLKRLNLGSINIRDNANLETIDNLDNLEYVEFGVSIRDNASLVSINGLVNLFENQPEIYEFYIRDNEVLSAIDLSGITYALGIFLYNNDALVSLNSFEDLNEVFEMYIEFNDSLSDFCALQNLFTNGTYDSSFVAIANNQYNPSIQDIIDGNCDQ